MNLPLSDRKPDAIGIFRTKQSFRNPDGNANSNFELGDQISQMIADKILTLGG